MPPIPKPTALQRLRSRVLKPNAPPVQTGKAGAYSGRTSKLARPIRELRLGAKMVGRAVRTSFRQTFRKPSTVLKASVRSVKDGIMQARQGTTSQTFKGPTRLKRSTKALLGAAKANKGRSPYARQQLAAVKQQSRKLIAPK